MTSSHQTSDEAVVRELVAEMISSSVFSSLSNTRFSAPVIPLSFSSPSSTDATSLDEEPPEETLLNGADSIILDDDLDVEGLLAPPTAPIASPFTVQVKKEPDEEEEMVEAEEKMKVEREYISFAAHSNPSFVASVPPPSSAQEEKEEGREGEDDGEEELDTDEEEEAIHEEHGEEDLDTNETEAEEAESVAGYYVDSTRPSPSPQQPHPSAAPFGSVARIINPVGLQSLMDIDIRPPPCSLPRPPSPVEDGREETYGYHFHEDMVWNSPVSPELPATCVFCCGNHTHTDCRDMVSLSRRERMIGERHICRRCSRVILIPGKHKCPTRGHCIVCWEESGFVVESHDVWLCPLNPLLRG